MEFRDLVAFIAVARHNSIAKAAVDLNVAQSAVSRRIKRLEQGLGVSLIERHSRGVAISEAGALLLEQLTSIESEIRALGQGSPEDLRIAIPHGATKLFGPALVEKYRQVRPGVRLALFERESLANRASVLSGAVHAGMAYECERSDDLDILPLTRERLVLVCPAGDDKLAQRESIAPAELAGLPLILPGPPHGYRRAVEKVARAVGIRPNIVLEVNGLAAMASMVQQRLGYAISTFAPLQAAVESGTVVCVPIDSPIFEVELGFLRRRDQADYRALGSFMTALRSVLAHIDAPQHCRILVDDASVACPN
jgi:LysR family nitrogen assimilation transcriptional regulator